MAGLKSLLEDNFTSASYPPSLLAPNPPALFSQDRLPRLIAHPATRSLRHCPIALRLFHKREMLRIFQFSLACDPIAAYHHR